jgi:hypothetical protein
VSLFGRKERRRIAELEDQLANRAVVKVPMPGGMGFVTEVRKGTWYTVSFQFMPSRNLRTFDFRDVFLGQSDTVENVQYFDGSTP